MPVAICEAGADLSLPMLMSPRFIHKERACERERESESEGAAERQPGISERLKPLRLWCSRPAPH